MGFNDAVRLGFRRYADFSGRSRRSEYWYWTLGMVIANAVLQVLGTITNDSMAGGLVGIVMIVFSLGTIIPSISVAVRRLHDLDKSGWWLLIEFIPVIGIIILIVWCCTRGTAGPNRFGPDPLGANGLLETL